MSLVTVGKGHKSTKRDAARARAPMGPARCSHFRHVRLHKAMNVATAEERGALAPSALGVSLIPESLSGQRHRHTKLGTGKLSSCFTLPRRPASSLVGILTAAVFDPTPLTVLMIKAACQAACTGWPCWLSITDMAGAGANSALFPCNFALCPCSFDPRRFKLGPRPGPVPLGYSL